MYRLVLPRTLGVTSVRGLTTANTSNLVKSSVLALCFAAIALAHMLCFTPAAWADGASVSDDPDAPIATYAPATQKPTLPTDVFAPPVETLRPSYQQMDCQLFLKRPWRNLKTLSPCLRQ